VVRCHEQFAAQLSKQIEGFAVVLIAVHPGRDPERGVDEDQRG
jgi:hypothetical protein